MTGGGDGFAGLNASQAPRFWSSDLPQAARVLAAAHWPASTQCLPDPPRPSYLVVPLLHSTFISTWPSLRQGKKVLPELLYPNPPTTHHRDLASFLAYAERTSLDVASTVYVGTRYEYIVSSTLSQYGIQAVRVGGASDNGIDLLGTWNVPSQNQPIKVILQCKGGSQRAGPSLVRELEGSFIGAPVGWRGSGVVALLVSEKTASKGVREALGRSRWPMGFVSCSSDGAVRQMLWNQRAEEEGLRGMGVTILHADAGNRKSQIVLTYNGERVRSDAKTEVVDV
ncbi:hypothetical protein CSUB01_01933 [Colletotrichum sublineola]|uniref:Uncharacterized protein n=1 Tax=Colletotrichum sublineola TaxID=1173701 RepID=A0A066XAR9_COLSU|nr:hypothetical protein CSUB01_01933 [Colletotrichum sublineola]